MPPELRPIFRPADLQRGDPRLRRPSAAPLLPSALDHRPGPNICRKICRSRVHSFRARRPAAPPLPSVRPGSSARPGRLTCSRRRIRRPAAAHLPRRCRPARICPAGIICPEAQEAGGRRAAAVRGQNPAANIQRRAAGKGFRARVDISNLVLDCPLLSPNLPPLALSPNFQRSQLFPAAAQQQAEKNFYPYGVTARPQNFFAKTA